jgi:DNA-binding transcriptional ArsR family regulator
MTGHQYRRRTVLGTGSVERNTQPVSLDCVAQALRSRGQAPRLTGKWLLAYHLAVGDVFKALADPTRRAILDELSDRNGQTLFELCVRLTSRHGLGSSRQAFSQHLDVLEAAGLIRTRRVGRYKFHDLETSPLREIATRWRVAEDRRSQ